MTIKITCITAFLIFLSHIGVSQLLLGKVRSESGAGASYVTVNFKNKKNNVVTNADGTFRIMATRLPDTLIFSSPGYEPYNVIVTEKNIKDPNFEVVLLNKRNFYAKSFDGMAEPMDKATILPPVGTSSSLSEVVVTSAFGTAGTIKEYGYSPGKHMKLPKSAAGEYKIFSPPATKAYYLNDSPPISRENGASSKILTAGEVNDFKKWKMWGDLTEKEFADLGKQWGIITKHRYCVQLQNKDYAAMVNIPVELVNSKTGKTIWKAVTDNTGKAELWSGLFDTHNEDAEYAIQVNGKEELNDPVEFSDGINHITIKGSCDTGNKVDIAFVVDATGSMEDEIDFLKLELEDVINYSMEKYKDMDLRLGSVFYRDLGDEFVTKKIPFQKDLLKVLNFIKLQKANGGGDFPEAVDSALDAAINHLEWDPGARTKIMFLVLDAPPHDYAKKQVLKLIEQAATKGIRIIPIACSGTDKSTEFLLRSMALATNGIYTFLTDHSGVGNKHIEPSTDKYVVELLNTVMKRLVDECIYVKPCGSVGPEDKEIPVKQPGNIGKVKLFPNPTNGLATLHSDSALKEIYITDFTGKILKKLNSGKNIQEWKINLQQYPNGTYIIKYITPGNKWGAEKLVLIH